MSTVDLGNICLNEFIDKQVKSSVLHENDNKVIDEHFDDDSQFSSQMIASVNDHDIYGLPTLRPTEDLSSVAFNHTHENGHTIHLPPSNIEPGLKSRNQETKLFN